MTAFRQKLRLIYQVDGETRELVTEHTAIDVRAWESETKKSALVEPTSASMKTWLAHHAAVRKGELNGDLKTYEAFDAVCIDIEGVPDVGPTEPTTKGRDRGTRKTATANSSAD
jgi:hypothetical protein